MAVLQATAEILPQEVGTIPAEPHPLLVQWNLLLTDLICRVRAGRQERVTIADLPPACHGAFSIDPYLREDENGTVFADRDAFLSATTRYFEALDAFDYDAYEAEVQTPTC